MTSIVPIGTVRMSKKPDSLHRDVANLDCTDIVHNPTGKRTGCSRRDGDSLRRTAIVRLSHPTLRERAIGSVSVGRVQPALMAPV